MTRQQLEHILRAAAAITGEDRFVVIGSQAILGQFPQAPPQFLISMEADVFTFRSAEDSDLIDGTIGEESPFHRMFGYFAHGVGPQTAVLPRGWMERLIEIRSENTGGATGLCPEVHDLAVSKLIPGRPKDLEFVAGLIQHGMADANLICQRISQTPLDPRVRDECTARLNRASRETPSKS